MQKHNDRTVSQGKVKVTVRDFFPLRDVRKMMSEKLANKGVSPNTCIHPCPTLGGLIEPIHHNDWINLPFENTSPLYTKLSESNLYSASSLLSSLSPKFFLAVLFSLICLLSLHLRYILLKASGGMRGNMRYVKTERSAHCQRVMRKPLQANGIQRQRLPNFQSNYLVINALRGGLFFNAVVTHFT